MKDFVYGLDPKAKEVHMHKFIKNDVICPEITNNNESMSNLKSLSSKFSEVISKVYYKGAISFRENIDPKILVSNLKSEIEMTE